VYSYYYLIYYSLDQSPLWIDHVDYCNRTKSPFADWSNDNYNRQNKKSAPEDIKEPQNIFKVVITIQFEKSALPMKRHFTRASLV
jgi:hypothetical protein